MTLILWKKRLLCFVKIELLAVKSVFHGQSNLQILTAMRNMLNYMKK